MTTILGTISRGIFRNPFKFWKLQISFMWMMLAKKQIWTVERKSNEEWTSQLWSQFMQLCKEAWRKAQDFNHMTSRCQFDSLPETELWSYWRWELLNGELKCSSEWDECENVHEINHIGTANVKCHEECRASEIAIGFLSGHCRKTFVVSFIYQAYQPSL